MYSLPTFTFESTDLLELNFYYPAPQFLISYERN